MDTDSNNSTRKQKIIIDDDDDSDDERNSNSKINRQDVNIDYDRIEKINTYTVFMTNKVGWS